VVTASSPRRARIARSGCGRSTASLRRSHSKDAALLFQPLVMAVQSKHPAPPSFLVALEPALAQFPPPPSTSLPPEATAPLIGKPKKKATPSEANITGTWIGQLTQVGSDAPHQFELAISASGAETRYPDLDCVGKLARIGSSKSYVFFVETITKGQADKGGRCPDGTVTVARQGDKLALRWFGSIQDDVVVAYGTLSRK